MKTGCAQSRDWALRESAGAGSSQLETVNYQKFVRGKWSFYGVQNSVAKLQIGEQAIAQGRVFRDSRGTSPLAPLTTENHPDSLGMHRVNETRAANDMHACKASVGGCKAATKCCEGQPGVLSKNLRCACTLSATGYFILTPSCKDER